MSSSNYIKAQQLPIIRTNITNVTGYFLGGQCVFGINVLIQIN